MNRVKIKVEIERDGKKIERDYTFDDVNIVEEYGIIRYLFDNESHIASNGQQRLLIKAWKGCNTFDTFEQESRG